MPQVSLYRSLRRQLRPVATSSEVQREKINIVPQLLERKCVVVYLQPWVGHVEDRHHTVTPSLLDR